MRPCKVISDDALVTVTSLLERPLYGYGQAARLLNVRGPDTVRRWVDGYERAGKIYPPVIRSESTGVEILTWGEFVETRYLARLRTDLSLQRLRGLVEALREQFGMPYPLAHHKPFFDGQDVVMELQEKQKVPRAMRLVVVDSGQLKLSIAAAAHVDRLVWGARGEAVAVRPLGLDQPVLMDPARGFGMPSLEGRNLRTETIAELSRSGEANEAIAAAYDLSIRQVEAAIRWELQAAQGTLAS